MAALATSAQVAKSAFIGQLPAKFQAAPEAIKFAAPIKVVALAKRDQVAAVTATTTLLVAGSAHAIEAEEIASALDQVESIARQTADVAKDVFDVAKQVTGQVVDAATPFVKAATPVVVDATKKAVDAATPFVSDLAGQASKALSEQGVELAPVISASKNAVGVASDAAGDAIVAATPVAQATFESLSAQDPAILAAGAGALVAIYLAAPAFFGSVVAGARGYAGEFSAAQALDLLSKEDFTLIDVRPDIQKSRSGVPSLPRNVKSKLVFVPVEEVDGKLRGQVRNAKKVESEIAALKISALKRLSKGSRVILIDSTGESAKLVAQSLVALGFKNTYIVRDGVDGGRGWIASRLATESVSISLAEVLSPSRILSSRSTGTVQVPNRRALPSGSK